MARRKGQVASLPGWLTSSLPQKNSVFIRAGEVHHGSLVVDRFPDLGIRPLGDLISQDQTLSIAPILEALDVVAASRSVFPWAKSPASYWTYYALYNRYGRGSWNDANYSVQIRHQMRDVLDYHASALPENIARSRGIGANSSPKESLRNGFYRGMAAHSLEREADRQSLGPIFRTMYHHIRADRAIPARTVKAFRDRWVVQSPVLRRRVAGRTIGEWIVRDDNPEDAAIKLYYRLPETGVVDLQKLLAGYFVLRAVYGYSLVKEYSGNKSEIRAVARAAESLLGKTVPEKRGEKDFKRLQDLLDEAVRSGVPPRKNEAAELSSLKKTPIFRNFRLGVFINKTLEMNRYIAAAAGSR